MLYHHVDDDNDDPMERFDAAENTIRRLEKDPRFQYLELEENFLTDWFSGNTNNLPQFLQTLRQNTTIRHLSASCEFISIVEEIAVSSGIEDFFDAVAKLPNLVKVEIQESIDFDGFNLSVSIFKNFMQEAKKLESLCLRFVELSPNRDQLIEDDFHASISSLTNGLDQNQENNQALLEAFRNHPSLREVEFAQLRLGEHLQLSTLIQGLASMPNLQTAKIHMAVRREQERRSIREGDDELDDVGVQAAFNPLCISRTLNVLELSSLRILDESKMLQALQNSTSIRELFIGHSVISFAGWVALAHILQRRHNDLGENSTSLQRLRLDSMTGLDDATVQILCRALRAPAFSNTLEELRFYNIMDMGELAWRAVAEMIRMNTSLSLLSFENCQGMDDGAAVGIADALDHNTTLRQLELQCFAGHCTRFSQKVGQQAFVDVLQSGRNITLEHLYTQAQGSHEEKLELYLKLNRSGLRQYVLGQNPLDRPAQGNSVALDFWSKLNRHKDDLDVIFYVLQTNPPFVLSCLFAL